jgi:D-alanyl-D-alanine carboxypeptidase
LKKGLKLALNTLGIIRKKIFIPKIFILILLPCLFCSCLTSDFNGNETKREVLSIVDEMYLDAMNHDANVPGVLVGVWDHKNKNYFTYSKGFADLENQEKLTRDHSFKIASVTKTMVCTIIAQLIDEGELEFDSKLSTWFPNLKESDRITVRMLGDMTSGYFDYLEDDDFLDSFDNTPYFTASPMELVQTGLSHDMEYFPGTGFNYSNTNTVLLGLIIETLTGSSLESQLKKRIFTPLNLEKTGAPESGSYLPEPKAESYHPDTRENWTDKMDYSPEYACGNAYSVIDELKTFIEALGKGELETRQTFEKRFIKGNLIPGTKFHNYYFGIIDYKGFLGHSGNTDYYLSEAYYNPHKDISLIILSNSSTAGFTTVMFEKIVDVLLQ